MRIVTTLLLSLVLLSACQKKKYSPYIGTYDGIFTEHLDSNNFVFDTIYSSTESVIEKDNKHLQFRDLPIPYKFIDNGYYADENFFTGIIWGRQINLRNDSVIYYHHESTAAFNWYIRFEGKRN